MISTASEIVIHPADRRACKLRDNFRSYRSLNKAFHSLTQINENTIAASAKVENTLKRAATIVFIPIVGEIEIAVNGRKKLSVDAGGIYSLDLSEDDHVQISNPYKNELVSYVECWFERDEEIVERCYFSSLDFKKNILMPIINLRHATLYLGEFEGRCEFLLPANSAKGIYAMALDGAFEFHNRLMLQMDGLQISGGDEFEFECLSQRGIILLIELNALKFGCDLSQT